MPRITQTAKHIAVLFAIIVSSVQSSSAQCNQEWSLPQNAHIRNVNRPGNIGSLPGAVYELLYDKNNCGCKTPQVAVGATGVKNGYAATSVKLKLRGYDCNGKVRDDEFYANNVKPGQWSGKSIGSGNQHWFRDHLNITVLRVEVEYFDEEQKVTYRYLTDYENNIDETFINNVPWRKYFDDREKEKRELAEKQKEAAKEKEEARQQEVQKQKEQVAQQQEQQRQEQQRQREERERTQAAYRQQYQNQADANINAARNNPSQIGGMADLNNAEINAAAAGNTAEVQEIERMKNAQVQQQTADLTDAAGQLANSIVDIANSAGRNRYSGPSPEEYYQQHLEGLKSSNNPDDLITVATNYSVRKKDYVSEVKYMEKAANLGSIKAMDNLLFIYSLGRDKTVPANMELENKWLSIAANAIADRLIAERDHKPLTQYQKNAWHEDTSPGDHNEVGAIASVVGDFIPSEKTPNPQDSINGIMALTYMKFLDQKYSNNYLGLSSSNFSSLVLSENHLVSFYTRGLDKSKPEVENLRLALVTYNTLKNIIDNYLEKGVDNKSYEKYYYHTTKGWMKDLKAGMKQRMKDLGLKEENLLATSVNNSTVALKKEDLAGSWNYTMSWPLAPNLSAINGKIKLTIGNDGSISGTIVSNPGQRLSMNDVFTNASFDGKNISFKVQTPVPDIMQEYNLAVTNKNQADGSCKNVSDKPTNRPASWDIPAEIHMSK